MRKFSIKENGITLIALVITIVVLLILAGVAIASISGDNGILTRAGEAVNKTNEASQNEQIELSQLEGQIDYYTGISYVQDGLILHYDGINNTGSGHSDTTTTWKDLSGNDYDVDNIPPDKWLDNGLAIEQLAYSSNKAIPAFGKDITMEIILLNKQRKYTEIGLGNGTTGYSTTLKLRIEGEIPFWNCYPNNYRKYNNVEPLNEITSFAYVNKYSEGKASAFMNNEKKETTVSDMTQISVPFMLSSHERLNGNIYAVRLYNRALTDDEIKLNYEIDKTRFGL